MQLACVVVSRLVDREDELAVLDGALACARAGAGHVVVVEVPSRAWPGSAAETAADRHDADAANDPPPAPTQPEARLTTSHATTSHDDIVVPGPRWGAVVGRPRPPAR